MLKVFVIIALMMICNVWAAGLSCHSCGGECVTACGTRRFRICCFNHLRRKRGSEVQIEDIPEYGDLDFTEKKAIFVIDEPGRWLWNLATVGNGPYSSSNNTN